MFNSHSDFDKCLKEGSFIDEIIILPLEGSNPEQIMTHFNSRENNWRLCKAKRIAGTDTAQFTKRTYLEGDIVDPIKYSEYYEKEIRPAIERSNNLIKKKFPEVVFFD